MTVNEVTSENVDKLIELRLMIDANRTIEELRVEAEKYVSSADRKAFISLVDGVAVGYIEVKTGVADLPSGAPKDLDIKDLAELVRLGVLAEYRKKGVGRTLMVQAEDFARSHGKMGMWLDYLDSNVTAEKFYAGNGYNDVSEFVDIEKSKTRKIAVKMFE